MCTKFLQGELVFCKMYLINLVVILVRSPITCFVTGLLLKINILCLVANNADIADLVVFGGLVSLPAATFDIDGR